MGAAEEEGGPRQDAEKAFLSRGGGLDEVLKEARPWGPEGTGGGRPRI